jgi:hypothetical protein
MSRQYVSCIWQEPLSFCRNWNFSSGRMLTISKKVSVRPQFALHVNRNFAEMATSSRVSYINKAIFRAHRNRIGVKGSKHRGGMPKFGGWRPAQEQGKTEHLKDDSYRPETKR